VVGYACIKRIYFACACEQQEPVQGSVHMLVAEHSFLAGCFLEALPLPAFTAVVASKAIAKMEKNAFFIFIFFN